MDNDLSALSASTLDDLGTLVRALHEIASSAVEGDMVREALIALQATDAGRRYLTAHPLAL